MDSFFGHLATLNFFILLVVITPTNYLVQGQGTSVGFYSRTCPNAESIVRSTVATHFSSDATVAPALLRLHFHDCFVRGCDASVLITGAGTERTAPINSGLRGYEVIDDAKTQLEAACPGIVSCADIVALAARDSVALTKGVSWPIPTGRRDGTVSLSAETSDLPGFRDSMDDQKKKFAAKNLSTQDLVALVGAHTIGTSACQFFSYRLYNFTTTGADASLAASFVAQLQALCPQSGSGTTRVGLDTGSVDKFDTSFYANVRDGRGVLESDSKLWTDASTKPFVQRFLGVRGLAGLAFNFEFAKSMVKMSNIGVKTGSDGEIRKICSAIN